MSGYVCTVAGGKGGVGKTTSAVNVGVALQERGYDVVVVDADLGMANLGAMLEIDHDTSVHEILSGEAAVSEALTDATRGVTVIPGEQSLEAFADADPAKLRKVIKTLRNAYDVVLIDTGAGLSHEVAVPLGLADGIILVTTPDDVAVGDTVKTAEVAERIDGKVLGSVLNRVNRTTDVGGIQDTLGLPLLAVIPDNTPATEQEPLVVHAPDSPAADAFEQLTANLDDIFFGSKAPADFDPVLEDRWFIEESAADTDADTDAESDEGEDEEDGGGTFSGVFGGLN
jgi:septum site-determining protein MinD